MPTLRRRDAGFAGLAAIVCGQQLSAASAAAIWSRRSRHTTRFTMTRCGGRAPIAWGASGSQPQKSKR